VDRVRKRSVGIFNIALTPFQLSAWFNCQLGSIVSFVDIPTFEPDSKISICRTAACLRPDEQIICAGHAKLKQVWHDSTTT
jgi:hypothetical protein